VTEERIKANGGDQEIVAPKITARALVLGLFLSVFFTWFAIGSSRNLAATQVPVVPYLLLFVMLLALNPLLRLIRVVRILTTAEVMTIFLMCFLSSMAASYSGALVTQISCQSNREWNQHSGEWDVHLEPFVKDYLVIVEEGRQAATKEMRRVVLKRGSCKLAFDTARDLRLQREQLGQAEAELGALASDAKGLTGKQRQVARLSKYLAFTEKRWQEEEGKGHVYETVLAEYEQEIEALTEEEKRRVEELAEMKESSFKEIDLFMKGLPDTMRAVPGLLYLPGEGWSGYSSRLTRVHYGRKALMQIMKAEELMAEGGPIPDEVDERLLAALAELDKITDDTVARERQAGLEAEIKATREKLSADEGELGKAREKKRFAKPDDAKALDKVILKIGKRVKATKKDIKDLEKELDLVVRPQVAAIGYAGEVRADLKEIQQSLHGDDPPGADKVYFQLQTLRPRFAHFDASLRRFLLGDIDWGIWVKPVASWMLVFIVLYVALMTMNALVYRQWAYGEKLIYPLAQLPETIAETGDDPKQWVPTICKSGLFWVGVSIAFGILTWNHLARTHVISGINPIKLTIPMAPYFDRSIFNGIKRIRFIIIFAVIGVSFLLPARITFSMWAFYVFFLIEGLILVWGGYQGYVVMQVKSINFHQAQGAGGVLVFAAFSFYASRDYFLAIFRKNSLPSLDPEERRSVRVNSAMFLGSAVALILLCVVLFGANLFYSALFTFVWLAIAMVYSRTIAEGGILSTNCTFTPYSLVQHTVGMKHSWSLPPLLAPLWYLNALTFPAVAPMMANALRLRDRIKLERRWFHVGVFSALVISLVVGVATRVIMVYNNSLGHPLSRGVKWNSLYVPRLMVQGSMAADNADGFWWLLSGMAIMAFILVMRKRWPWLVHPIGLLMLSSSVILGYWGSLMIGWSCKVLVSKYGSRHTYERLRYLFIGLIVGELLSAFFGFHSFSHGWGR